MKNASSTLEKWGAHHDRGGWHQPSVEQRRKALRMICANSGGGGSQWIALQVEENESKRGRDKGVTARGGSRKGLTITWG